MTTELQKLREFATFETEAFDFTEKEHHINPCCRGEEIANWLLEKFGASPEVTAQLYQEDFGWVIDYRPEGASGVIMITVVFFDEYENLPKPSLCVNVDVRQTWVASIFKRNQTKGLASIKDETIKKIDTILKAEAAFKKVEWWHDGPACGDPAPHPDFG